MPHAFPCTHYWRLLTLALCCAVLGACSQEQRSQQEAYVFGTRVEVVALGVPQSQARAALSEVLREFDRLHRSLHAWQRSDLTNLNDQLSLGETARVSPELAGLLVTAQRYDEASGGLFNPAMGGLIAAWGFHSDNFIPQRPDPARLAQLLSSMGRRIDVTVLDQRVTSLNRHVQFDFGGLAKGYALDRAATILQQHGVRNALINIGGNVMALGSKNGQPWQVGIQHPRRSGPLATLALYDGEAIGTSGDYQRFFELDGRRYSHLIDPRTGEPAQGTQAIAVLIPAQKEGLLSDIASKPIFLAGNQWRSMALRLGFSHVLRIDEQGRIQLTAPMRARLRWSDSASPDFTVVE